MSFRTFIAAFACVAAFSTASQAATINLGDVTDGASGSYELVADESGNKVDFFNIVLNADPGSAVSAIVITVQSVLERNFHPVIGFADSTGVVLGNTPNTTNGGLSDSIPIILSLSGTPFFANGDYTIAVGGHVTNFTDPIQNTTSGAFFGDGQYTLTIETTISPVPLPAGGLLILGGLGAFAFARRQQRRT